MGFWSSLGSAIVDNVKTEMDAIKQYRMMSTRQLAEIAVGQRSGKRAYALGVLKERYKYE